MKKRRLFITLTLAVMMVMQGFMTPVQAEESGDPYGLVFNAAKSNAVELNEKLSNVPSTFEMRAKFAVNPNQRQVLFGNYNANAGTQFNLELKADNQFRYYELSNSKLIDKSTQGANIATGKWTHLAVTRDVVNKRVTVIQDGAVIATFENLDLAAQVTPQYVHSIGKDTRNSMHIRAEVAEVRLWSDVRTLDEIKDNVNIEIKGSEEGLMHAWSLDSSVPLTNMVVDKAGKINGTALGFKKAYEIETPYISEFEGTGTDFTNGQLELMTEERLSDAPRTVEAWVNVPANTPKDQPVGVVLGNYEDQYYSDVSRFNFEIGSNGNPKLYWRADKSSEINYYSDINVNVGDWVHVAMVLDDKNNTASTYINGEKLEEEVLKAKIPNDRTARELKIGSDFRGYGTDGKPLMTFKGQIADVRVWSTIRTDEEIKTNYKVSLQGNEAGLMGNWKLNQAANGVYPDVSANKNDGIIYDNESTNWLEPEFAEGDYTIAVIPDTQYMTRLHPEEMKKYMKWIKDHADDMNIKLAIGVGDIVDTASSTAEWAVASEAYSYLDGIVPYVAPPGNHDVILNKTNLTRNYTNYNNYFPYSKYSKLSTFGGAFQEGKMENTYHYFDIGGVQYMVIAMEFAPNDDVLAWANQIATENPDKRIIVETHNYVYHNGELISTRHIDYPTAYINDANNGDDMWNEFVSKHENIVLVLSGHIGYPDLVVREDIGEHGNSVQQMLVDAQFMQPRDLGMLMLMTFKEGSNNVNVNWYSVKNDKLFRDKNQFAMDLNLYPDDEPNPGENGMQLSAVDQSVTKGSIFKVPVNVEQASDLVGLEGVIRYDEELLTLESFELTKFKETNATNTATPGTVSFASVSDAALGTDEPTVVANLVFRAKADIAKDETTAISFELLQAITMNATGETAYARIGSKNAAITITNMMLGDVNGDNKIDVMDATGILKLIVIGPSKENAAQYAAADVNGDKAVDTLDVLALLQIIADKLAGPNIK
ncbi:LamG-like jellyroll fold domain-containing protein [Paenibacillus sp. 2TAB26]|uniref:LamG-like jellyroll fold domain-containing protein n=1 Tax=Paenibacillus sp. 2TAB26 TaxID=3233005 RepID=UPI003F9E1ED4